ncbi:MAG: glycosyltransferase family 4 protein [Candidatus Dormibacteria bacterium]
MPLKLVYVTVAATYPPRRGHQVRVAGLLSNLGPGWRAESWSLTFQRTDLPLPRRDLAVGPYWTDHRTLDPITTAWMAALGRAGYPPVFIDRVAGWLPRRRLRASLGAADVVVVAPPYPFAWVRRATPAAIPLVLDENSLEVDLYTAQHWWSRPLVTEVARAEGQALRGAELVITSSEEDAVAARRGGARSVVVIPNAVDVLRIRPLDPVHKRPLRIRLGLPESGVLAVFIGSAHPPNVRALEILERQAALYSAAGITVVGIGRATVGRRPVEGILYVGEVLDIVPYLQAADIALCPLETGSGTSFKSLESMAAGLPLVSTRVGVRGLGVTPGLHAEVCDVAEMPMRAASITSDPDRMRGLSQAGRALIEERFSFAGAADVLGARLSSLVRASQDRAPTVLYVAHSTGLYGSDRCLLRMVSAHVAAGGRALVAVPGEGPLVPLLRQAGAEVVVTPLAVLRRRGMRPRGILEFVRAATGPTRTLTSLGRAERVEIVHSNSSAVVSGAMVARHLSVPHVWHLREHLDRGPAERALSIIIGASAQRVVAVSRSVARAFAGPRGNRIAQVIHDGVDPERFSKLPSREVACREFGLDPSLPVVTVAARLNPWKGQHLLVKAMAALPDDCRGAQLLLAGDCFPGDEWVARELQKELRTTGLAGRTAMPGFLQDVSSLLAAADIVVSPSTRPDPFPNAVLDALTAGRPVVASNIGGHSEMVRDGVDGLLFEAGDAQSLATALWTLLADPVLRQQMGRAASAGRQRFSAERMNDAIAALYRDLVRS